MIGKNKTPALTGVLRENCRGGKIQPPIPTILYINSLLKQFH